MAISVSAGYTHTVASTAWETVQRLARALGTDCTAFTDDELDMPEEQEAQPRGRPRKAAAAEAEKPAGKKRTKKGG